MFQRKFQRPQFDEKCILYDCNESCLIQSFCRRSSLNFLLSKGIHRYQLLLIQYCPEKRYFFAYSTISPACTYFTDVIKSFWFFAQRKRASFIKIPNKYQQRHYNKMTVFNTFLHCQFSVNEKGKK